MQIRLNELSKPGIISCRFHSSLIWFNELNFNKSNWIEIAAWNIGTIHLWIVGFIVDFLKLIQTEFTAPKRSSVWNQWNQQINQSTNSLVSAGVYLFFGNHFSRIHQPSTCLISTYVCFLSIDILTVIINSECFIFLAKVWFNSIPISYKPIHQLNWMSSVWIV